MALIEGQYKNHPISGKIYFKQDVGKLLYFLQKNLTLIDFFKNYEAQLEISVNISGLPTSLSSEKHGLHVHNQAIVIWKWKNLYLINIC